MPALKAFRRRWNLGSDDLVFPGLVEISVRGVWLVILLVIYVWKMDELTCDNAYKIRTFYIGTLCLLATQIMLCTAMTVLSSRGTMVNRSPRHHVATVLYIRVIVFIPEVAWAILGTIWTFEKDAGCQKLLVRSGKGIVLVEWIIIFSIIVSILVMFDPLGRRHMRQRSMRDYNQVWHRRCRVLCCCIWADENRKGAFDEIADMLTKFFKYKDIVLTDVIAGLVLLHMRTANELKHSSQRSHPDHSSNSDAEHNGANNGNNAEPDHTTMETTDTADDGAINLRLDVRRQSEDTLRSAQSLDSLRYSRPNQGQPQDWMTVDNAEYYCRYAVGSYGSYNYVMCRNCDQRCGLCSKYRCLCESRQFSADRVEGDNSCECQMAAVLQYTSINPDDILFANFENQIYETPYFVALDENRKSVVIAIRGTKTFQDAITDLTAYGEGFDAEGVPAGNVHGGILKVAQNIYTQLEENHILDRIPQDYKLVLTGHSLGAGAAVLLSMMLKNRYPDISCFAFSPPGGLVSLGLQIYTEEFVCSVVLGNDIIPRLSLIAMEKLKYSLLEVIKTSKLPKYKILASGVLAMCCGRRIDTDSGDLMQTSPSTAKLFDMTEDSIRAATRSHHNHNLGDHNNTNDLNTNVTNPDIPDVIGSATVNPVSSETGNDDVNNKLVADGDETDAKNNDVLTEEAMLAEAAREDEDWEMVPTVSLTNIRRHKDDDIEPQIRPTTFQQFHKSHMKWKKDREDRRTGLMVTDPLYLPGHVLHVLEEEDSSRLKPLSYCTTWSRPKEFVEIIVSPNMLHHHHGYVMRQALQQVVAEKQYESSHTDRTQLIHLTQPANTGSAV